jgi:formate dehydrogenase gamma subunit
MRISLISAFALFLALALNPSIAPAETYENSDCMDCHGEADVDMPAVDLAAIGTSIHGDVSCTDCHDQILDLPHEEALPPANCGGCHDEAAAIYTRHGLGIVGTDSAVPTCTNCHGKHDILAVDDKASRVNILNLPMTCGICHEDEKFTTDQHIRFKHPVRVYSSSVHGRAAMGGRYSAATCNDCHSTGGSAHMILSPGDVRSTINHFNIPKTCGKCHKYIEQDYWEGIHGELTLRGQVESPICTSCHGEHNILPVADPRSPVSAHRLAEVTCTPCHESAALNEKYELPTGRLHSYQDSYHGLKSQAGDVTVANCASCHGAHRILPSADPGSTIHPNNLQHSCGTCHPSISSEIASVSIHEEANGIEAGAAGIVRMIYIVLIVVVIGSMIIHWLLDLLKQLRDLLRSKNQVRRMEGDEVVQHAVLAISFTVLVATGFSLRFYDSWWSEWLFGWEGGYRFRGDLHRIAGVVLLIGSVWHALFLLTKRGRRYLKDMMPSMLDMKQFITVNLINLGVKCPHPQFGRFSYVEKAEYWALVWGTAIMGVTGALLWFDNLVINWLPKGVLGVMLVIHYYEAWLAFLAILIWHLYSTVFNPKVYPMNPSWINGKMPMEQFEQEHPLAAGEMRKKAEELRKASDELRDKAVDEAPPAEPASRGRGGGADSAYANPPSPRESG